MKSIIDHLIDFESGTDAGALFSYSNYSAWPGVKNAIVNYYISENVKVGVSAFSALKLNTIIYYVVSAWNLIHVLFKKDAKFIFFGAVTSAKLVETKLTDAFAVEVDLGECVCCLNLNNLDRKFSIRTLVEKRIIFDNLLLFPFCRALALYLRLKGVDQHVQYNKAAKQLAKNNIHVPVEILKHEYLKCLASYHLYNSLLKPFRWVRDVYVISSYSKSYIISACKARELRSIEYQHGFVGMTHNGYNYSQQQSQLPVPDRLCVLNSFWFTELEKSGFATRSEVVLMQKSKYDIACTECDHEADFVVFTGQGVFYDELVKDFEDVIADFSNRNLRLIYKPHPNESESDLRVFDSLVQRHRNFVIDKENETTALIKKSVAHISYYSSCHFDAVHWKTKTYILYSNDNFFMSYYIRQNPEVFVELQNLREILKSDEISLRKNNL